VGIEANMGTVEALMRPPGDPFHERLVAAYPQIRRFLPALIEALELQAIDSAAPVLDCACRKPMPPGDIHESRHQRGRVAGPGNGPGR
jgi:hypothetical protein